MRILECIKSGIKEIKVYQTGKPSVLPAMEFVKLSSNENPLGTSKQVLKALNESISNLNIYPDGNSSMLKKSLGDFYNINSESFIVGNGSEEIIDMLLQAMVESGDEVIFADPSFIKYEISVIKCSGTCVKVRLDSEYKHDLEQMLKLITSKTKVIFICNPNNPTGTMVKKEDLWNFIDRVDSNILIVIDEAYYEYIDPSNDPNIIEIINEHENVVILRTFSKAYGLAGLRVGYGIAHPDLISMLNRVRNPFNVNTLAQNAAVVALLDQEHVINSKNFNEAGKLYLYKHLEQLGYDYIPTEANFIMIDVNVDSHMAFKLILEEGIIVRPGDALGMCNWIRVTIGEIKDIEKILKVLDQMKGRKE